MHLFRPTGGALSGNGYIGKPKISPDHNRRDR